MFDRANDLRIEGGNVANVVIFIKQELGVGVLILLLVASLFFRSS